MEDAGAFGCDAGGTAEGEEDEAEAESDGHEDEVVVLWAAVAVDFFKENWDGADEEAEESEAGGDFEVVEGMVDEAAEGDNTD